MLHLPHILVVSDQLVESGDPDLAWARTVACEFLLRNRNHAGNVNTWDFHKHSGLVLRMAYAGNVAIIYNLGLFLPRLVVLAVVLEHLDDVKVTKEAEVFLDGTCHGDVGGTWLGEVCDECVDILAIPLLEIGLNIECDL